MSTSILKAKTTPSKAELREIYSDFPSRKLRNIINDILNRFGRSKNVKVLKPLEYKALLEEMEGVISIFEA